MVAKKKIKPTSFNKDGTPRKPGSGRPRLTHAQIKAQHMISMKYPKALVKHIDRYWRKRYPEATSRSWVIRRLVEIGLEAEGVK